MARYVDRDIVLQIIDSYAKTVTEDGKVIVDAVRDIVSVITPTADVVGVDKVAEMFAEQFGDKCPCNFNDNSEWLTLYCEYTNTCDCPCEDGWKQFIKHYGKRKEGD